MISLAAAASLGFAMVMHDRAALRAAPAESARVHAVLAPGELLEVRGAHSDFLQVYDHRRERAGFVRASQARRLRMTPEEAPELGTILRFLRDMPGHEALGIGFAAAYLQAAPAETLAGEEGVEALDALGTLASRLAQRASSAAHLEAAAAHGVGFAQHERGGHMVLCYDGDAFRRVLAMRSGAAQRARAALALTQPECASASGEWRAEVLDLVDAGALAGPMKNRVLMRRASVWSSLAYQRARAGEPAGPAALRAAAELAAVDRSELTEADARSYREAALRVRVARWASAPAQATPAKGPHIATEPGKPGETCIVLLDPKPLVRRCTYGIVWSGSVTRNSQGSAYAVAVQPTEAWRELWLFHKTRAGWRVRILPPAATLPSLGYAELAGWAAGGTHARITREALSDKGEYRRRSTRVALRP